MRRRLDFDALGRALAASQSVHLDDDASAASDERIRRRIVDGAALDERGAVRRRWRVRAGLVLAMTFGVACAFFLRPRLLGTHVVAEQQQLSFTFGDPPREGHPKDRLSAPEEKSAALRFSEGTIVSLRPSARARVLDVTDRGAEIILESGAARFEVAHRRNTRWQVRSGSVLIEVVGTTFEAQYDALKDEVVVIVDDGSVAVSGCGLGQRVVRAGERLGVSCATKGPAPAAAELPSGASSHGEHPPVRGPSWVDLARAGRYAEAYARVSVMFERECMTRGPAELWLLGDTARLTGHDGSARRAYEVLRDRFPGTDAAASGAFALGRLAAEGQGTGGPADGRAAERWFETYLGERPAGALAKAALARLMDLRNERGDRAGAARAAQEYLRRFPAGPRAPGARALLVHPGGPAENTPR
jgi:ferric-dicitrate binding protein FerR (iron transport regulator)